jgi:hypothetical protein
MKTIDTVLIVAGLVAAAMVGLWAFDAIVGLVLWFFKIVILAIIVVVIVRLLTRRRN